MCEAVKLHGGSFWSHPLLIHDRAQETARAGNVQMAGQIQQAEETVESEMKVMFMLVGANSAKHEGLRMRLQNSYTMGCNEYPANTTKLLPMIITLNQNQGQYASIMCKQETLKMMD